MVHDTAAADILKFWFKDIEKVRWFRKDAAFDRLLGQRFGDVLSQAKSNRLDHWCATPGGSLALIIVLDQFSRNVYRDTPRAFEADAKALQLTVDGMQRGFDKELSPEQRSFYYLPLRHAEDLAMQELGLAKTREINAAGYGTDQYALNHLEIIRRFGRFPHRNGILGRPHTAEEALYLKDGKAGF